MAIEFVIFSTNTLNVSHLMFLYTKLFNDRITEKIIHNYVQGKVFSWFSGNLKYPALEGARPVAER
jgi:hypothetical protein